MSVALAGRAVTRQLSYTPWAVRRDDRARGQTPGSLGTSRACQPRPGQARGHPVRAVGRGGPRVVQPARQAHGQPAPGNSSVPTRTSRLPGPCPTAASAALPPRPQAMSCARMENSPVTCRRRVGKPETRGSGREVTPRRARDPCDPSQGCGDRVLCRPPSRQDQTTCCEAMPINPAQAPDDAVRTGPARSFESRTCTAPSPAATSTHCPPSPLL